MKKFKKLACVALSVFAMFCSKKEDAKAELGEARASRFERFSGGQGECCMHKRYLPGYLYCIRLH